ncbi:unnamed protein product, partial [Allacma fusca]
MLSGYLAPVKITFGAKKFLISETPKFKVLPVHLQIVDQSKNKKHEFSSHMPLNENYIRNNVHPVFDIYIFIADRKQEKIPKISDITLKKVHFLILPWAPLNIILIVFRHLAENPQMILQAKAACEMNFACVKPMDEIFSPKIYNRRLGIIEFFKARRKNFNQLSLKIDRGYGNVEELKSWGLADVLGKQHTTERFLPKYLFIAELFEVHNISVDRTQRTWCEKEKDCYIEFHSRHDLQEKETHVWLFPEGTRSLQVIYGVSVYVPKSIYSLIDPFEPLTWLCVIVSILAISLL